MTHFFGYPAKLILDIEGEEVEIENFLDKYFNLDTYRILNAINEHRLGPAYYRVGTYSRKFTTLADAEKFRYLLEGHKPKLPIRPFTADGKLIT